MFNSQSLLHGFDTNLPIINNVMIRSVLVTILWIGTIAY